LEVAFRGRPGRRSEWRVRHSSTALRDHTGPDASRAMGSGKSA